MPATPRRPRTVGFAPRAAVVPHGETGPHPDGNRPCSGIGRVAGARAKPRPQGTVTDQAEVSPDSKPSPKISGTVGVTTMLSAMKFGPQSWQVGGGAS